MRKLITALSLVLLTGCGTAAAATNTPAKTSAKTYSAEIPCWEAVGKVFLEPVSTVQSQTEVDCRFTVAMVYPKSLGIEEITFTAPNGKVGTATIVP
jgi:hypothetical protein